MPRIFLGLGSNEGDREHNLARAVVMLARREGVQLHRCSSLYDSAPFGPPQGRYLNAVIEIETSLTPEQLFKVCKEIERELGRVHGGPRWGPRCIDLDLVLADDVIAHPHLQVPHLEMHKRAFVLAPLCELFPEATHPVLGDRLIDLLQSLGDQDVRRVGPFYVDT